MCHGLYFHSHFPKLFVNYFSFQDLYLNRFEHRNHPNNCPHRHFLLVSRNSWICFFCLFSLYPHQELFHRFAAQVDRVLRLPIFFCLKFEYFCLIESLNPPKAENLFCIAFWKRWLKHLDLFDRTNLTGLASQKGCDKHFIIKV